MKYFTCLVLLNNICFSRVINGQNENQLASNLDKSMIKNEGKESKKTVTNQFNHILILAKENPENARKLGFFERIKIELKTIFGYYVKLELKGANNADKNKKIEIFILKKDDKGSEGISLGFFERFKIAFKQFFGMYMMIEGSVNNDKKLNEIDKAEKSKELEDFESNDKNIDTNDKTINPTSTKGSKTNKKKKQHLFARVRLIIFCKPANDKDSEQKNMISHPFVYPLFNRIYIAKNAQSRVDTENVHSDGASNKIPKRKVQDQEDQRDITSLNNDDDKGTNNEVTVDGDYNNTKEFIAKERKAYLTQSKYENVENPKNKLEIEQNKGNVDEGLVKNQNDENPKNKSEINQDKGNVDESLMKNQNDENPKNKSEIEQNKGNVDEGLLKNQNDENLKNEYKKDQDKGNVDEGLMKNQNDENPKNESEINQDKGNVDESPMKNENDKSAQKEEPNEGKSTHDKNNTTIENSQLEENKKEVDETCEKKIYPMLENEKKKENTG